MTKKDQPAFPSGDWEGYRPEGGITIRQYYAARAMAAWMVAFPNINENHIAKSSFKMADAMIEAENEFKNP